MTGRRAFDYSIIRGHGPIVPIECSGLGFSEPERGVVNLDGVGTSQRGGLSSSCLMTILIKNSPVVRVNLFPWMIRRINLKIACYSCTKVELSFSIHNTVKH